jgi:aminocarboxymuconate-semialdehyde decarboxylase
MKYDLHTHYYPTVFFDRIREQGREFSFATDPTGRTIITYGGARFFGITPPMTDPAKRLADMDRVGIDVEVISLSTPNVFFVEASAQAAIAREVNDAYAGLIAKHPARFKGFASIPMDDPDAALKELHRAIHDLKMNGVVLLSNIRGRALTAPAYRPFFEEANRLGVCIFLHPMLPANAAPFGEYVLGPLVGFPFDTTLAVARMCFDGLFRELPNIRWLIGHLGGAIPWLMERLDSGYRDFAECRAKIDAPPSTYLKRLYYDTVTFSPYNLRHARDLVGADHMAMGSDYPHLLGSIDRAVSSIELLDIPAAEKERIFSGTALSILNNIGHG